MRDDHCVDDLCLGNLHVLFWEMSLFLLMAYDTWCCNISYIYIYIYLYTDVILEYIRHQLY